MKIGIISDTHDNIEALEKAIDKFNEQKVELVFHCGDWVAPFMAAKCEKLNCKIIAVFGNNDGDLVRLVEMGKDKISFEAQCAETEIDGRKMAIYHGTSKALLLSLLYCGKYDVVFSGHTHIGLIEKTSNTLHVNPGSPSFPRNHVPSIAIYETKTNNAELILL